MSQDSDCLDISENSLNQNHAYVLNQLATARKEIANLRQQIKALGHIHQKECQTLRETISDWKCAQCQCLPGDGEPEAATEAVEALSDSERFPIKSIGFVRTSFPEKRATSRQPGICNESIGQLVLNNEVFTNPSHALDGLSEFSHMWILFYFHRNDSTHIRAKVTPPRLNGLRTGVFASRSPHRPSPIGLSLVSIDRIEGSIIYFSGVDMVDGTPVIDIKPYIPQYDTPFNNSISLPVDASSSRHLDGHETSQERDEVSFSEEDSSLRLSNFSPLRTEINRIGEREAPDGEESENSNTNASNSQPVISDSTTENIRVPNWIDQPPVNTLEVHFSERAITQLQIIKNQSWEETKNAITNVLREDPRSIYLRTKWGNQFFTFRISNVHVSCKFDDNARKVNVFQVHDMESIDNIE